MQEEVIPRDEPVGDESSVEKKKKKLRSTVWKDYHLVEKTIDSIRTDFAVCKYCDKEYKYAVEGKTGSTGNLKRHTKKDHPGVLGNVVAENTEFVFNQDNYRAALLNWIVERQQSNTEPQEESFFGVIRSLNPNADMVSSEILKQNLMEKYSEKANAVKIKLSQVPGKISFTVDSWVTKRKLPLVNIRAHWIDINWKQESALLDFCHIEGHYGSNLGDIFVKCMDRFEVPMSKVFSVTFNNNLNNSEFIDSLQDHANRNGVDISSKENLVRCVACIKNLAVEDILKTLNCSTADPMEVVDSENFGEVTETSEQKTNVSIVVKLRKFIMIISNSYHITEELKEMCNLMVVPYQSLLIDVSESEMRYSTSKMIERVFELKVPLRALCIKLKSLSSFIFSESEWTELHNIKLLLQKFDRIDRHQMISSYLPTQNWLIDSLKSFIKENPGHLADAATAGLVKLKTYELDILTSKIQFISTFLNPALKMNYYKEHSYSKASMKDIEKSIQSTFKDNYEGISDTVPEKSEEEDDEFFNHMFKRAKVDKLSKEFQKYVRLPLSTSKVDILAYWQSQETELPRLTKMARDYLAAQSSSVSIERYLSARVDMMSSGDVREYMCLKIWSRDEI